ncbi:MAG: S1 RNA-binding domain-containing protein [Leptolyngbyaceae cyanobacterium bins.59]|nr:S1 RNA-binding domain-containing protein [Leptolyngbyaceae cyanobacterium bins.59]
MDPKATRSPNPEPAFSMDDFAKALEKHDYQFQKGQVVRGKVFSYESGGAYVDIGGKSSAFLPTEEASLSRVDDLSTVLPLQEELEFLIVRDQDADGQVTLSRRRLELKRVWERLAEMQTSNQTVAGRVSGMNKGGVTIDVQGLRGFIPRSHLVEKENLESLKGKTLTVAFLEVNPETNKLVLSERLAARSASIGQLEAGQLIEGKIASLRPFGAFIDFAGTTGLLHINQISQKYVSALNDVLQVGQSLKAVIVDLDQTRGRISLSTRVLESYPGEMLEKPESVMEEAENRMEKVQKNLTKEG